MLKRSSRSKAWQLPHHGIDHEAESQRDAEIADPCQCLLPALGPQPLHVRIRWTAVPCLQTERSKRAVGDFAVRPRSFYAPPMIRPRR